MAFGATGFYLGLGMGFGICMSLSLFSCWLYEMILIIYSSFISDSHWVFIHDTPSHTQLTPSVMAVMGGFCLVYVLFLTYRTNTHALYSY